MELSPQAVAAATFKSVKRGYDPDEVRAYLVEVSASLEASHQQATAMEARARAAIAKLQDATQSGGTVAATPAAVPDGADAISRALLLAQRTADSAVAEARAEAAALVAKAETEASSMTARADAEAASITSGAKAEAIVVVDQAHATASKLVEAARAEARRAKDEDQLRVEREVRALAVRREALLTDVEALEQFVQSERTRLRAASAAMLDLVNSESIGLAPSDRPSLQAGSTLPAPTSDDTPSGLSRIPDADSMPPPVAEPIITGQLPIVGAQPLISPMPSSNEEARSMWHEAELADAAASAADETAAFDATPPDALAAALLEDATPAEGIRVGDDAR